MAKLNINIPDAQKGRLDLEAKRQNCTITSLVVQALERLLGSLPEEFGECGRVLGPEDLDKMSEALDILTSTPDNRHCPQ